MKPRIEVEVDPSKLIGVYSDQPGYVSQYDADGSLHSRRAATEAEAIQEQNVRRLENIATQLELKLAQVFQALENLEITLRTKK